MTDEKKVHQTACIMDKEGLVEHIMLLETYVEALRLYKLIPQRPLIGSGSLTNRVGNPEITEFDLASFTG
ncbi:hypothetical protein N7455_011277 [Penicillium solitum]|uniref:uncharacterized protein n=1 Tax=Penicillium solitum TaxID=60172 RepID=UPI0032C42DF9|nr:hypothetical protein N7455_011277 [Penicillium solitum]